MVRFNPFIQTIAFLSMSLFLGIVSSKAVAQDSKRLQSILDRYRYNTLQGEAVNRVQPSYPEEAKRMGIKGTVIVEVIVDEEGNVTSTKLLYGNRLLRKACLEAAKQWKFKPTKLNGKPVKVVGPIRFYYPPRV